MRPVDYSLLVEKRCSICKETKPVSNFGTYKDATHLINGWRYYAQCRDCARAASREYGKSNRERRNARLRQWRNQNPEAALANEQRKRLRYKYDLSPDQVAAIFIAQKGRCLICNRLQRLSIDHNHTTGRVRGGLCTRCNVELGRVEADLSRAERTPLGPMMLAYLEDKDGNHVPCHADVLLSIAAGGVS